MSYIFCKPSLSENYHATRLSILILSFGGRTGSKARYKPVRGIGIVNTHMTSISMSILLCPLTSKLRGNPNTFLKQPHLPLARSLACLV